MKFIIPFLLLGDFSPPNNRDTRGIINNAPLYSVGRPRLASVATMRRNGRVVPRSWPKELIRKFAELPSMTAGSWRVAAF